MNIKKIIEYYNQCEIDYSLFWGLKKNLSMHMGYWDDTTKNLSQALLRENQILAEIAEIKKSDLVLDAGCGVGGGVIYLAEKVGCNVVGISIVDKQIEKARLNAIKIGVFDKTNFKTVDFVKTGLPDNSFDVVWAIESVCYANDKKDFIQEAYRVLKKGGRLVVADAFALDNLTEKQKKYLSETARGWMLDDFCNKNYFQKSLQKIGFSNILFKDITKNIMPSSRRLYILSFPGIIFGKILNKIKFRSKIQMGNIWAAHYQYKALKEGSGQYGIFYAIKK